MKVWYGGEGFFSWVLAFIHVLYITQVLPTIFPLKLIYSQLNFYIKYGHIHMCTLANTALVGHYLFMDPKPRGPDQPIRKVRSRCEGLLICVCDMGSYFESVSAPD